MEKTPIRVAIVGVGNCASALLQGIEFYRENSRKNPKCESLGLMHLDIGGYKPWDIEVPLWALEIVPAPSCRELNFTEKIAGRTRNVNPLG